MPIDSPHPQAALRFEAEVREHGRIELTVPYAPGARVVVFVVEEPADAVDDLVAASQTSMDFWDNPYDDQDWNVDKIYALSQSLVVTTFGRVNAGVLTRIRSLLQQLTMIGNP